MTRRQCDGTTKRRQDEEQTSFENQRFVVHRLVSLDNWRIDDCLAVREARRDCINNSIDNRTAAAFPQVAHRLVSVRHCMNQPTKWRRSVSRRGREWKQVVRVPPIICVISERRKGWSERLDLHLVPSSHSPVVLSIRRLPTHSLLNSNLNLQTSCFNDFSCSHSCGADLFLLFFMLFYPKKLSCHCFLQWKGLSSVGSR